MVMTVISMCFKQYPTRTRGAPGNPGILLVFLPSLPRNKSCPADQQGLALLAGFLLLRRDNLGGMVAGNETLKCHDSYASEPVSLGRVFVSGHSLYLSVQ